ncbi:Uncharacterised protein [Mycobacteroides abscessus]|nr:Uncharacterised protein [Mycobacteroides abscessus]
MGGIGRHPRFALTRSLLDLGLEHLDGVLLLIKAAVAMFGHAPASTSSGFWAPKRSDVLRQ